MTRFMVACALTYALLPSAAAVGAETGAAEEAKAFYQSLYAEKVKAAKTASEKVAVAKMLVVGAKESSAHPALVKLLCEQAYDLANMTQEGHATAAEAMQILMASAPDQRAPAAEKLAALYQRMMIASRGDERTRVGQLLIDLLLVQAAEVTAKGEPAEAVAIYRRIVSAATDSKSPRTVELRKQLDGAVDRQRASNRIGQLQERLLRSAADFEAARELTLLYLLDLNQPENAAKYAGRAKDEKLARLVPLAAEDPSAVAEEPALELADWFRDLGKTGGEAARASALTRAKEWYQHFLSLHQTQDLSRKRVELTIVDLDAQLAKMAPVAARTASSKYKVIAKVECKEAAAVYAEIAQRSESLAKEKGEITLVNVHDATKLSRHSGSPQKVAGSYSDTPVVGTAGGIMFYGPYEQFEPGRYVIVYRFRFMQEETGDSLCFLDVARNGNTVSGHRPGAKELVAKGWTSIGIPLKVDQAQALEYRLWPNNRQIALDRVYVFRLP